MKRADVLVVGGGPAGAAAAAFCAQQGRHVILLEHKRFPRHKVCGDVINPRCWPVLERLGVAAKLRQQPCHQAPAAVFHSSRNDAVTIDASFVCMRRSLFDLCLLNHARACGVEVIEQETVHAIEPGGRVTATSGTYEAAVMIGADGRNSLVARRLGLRPPDDSPPVAKTLQGHFPAPPALDDALHLHLFPGGYSGAVRVDGDRVNLCIVTRRDLRGLAHDPARLLAQTVNRNPHFRSWNMVPRPESGLHGAYPLQRGLAVPQAGNCWLVGDALRVMEPFTGQGMFFALRTGELAAQAIGGQSSDYAIAVRDLYRQFSRTNRLVRPLLYADGVAAVAIRLLRHWPAGLKWLASNVVAS